jgi:alpha-glucoside transport system permease protein
MELTSSSLSVFRSKATSNSLATRKLNRLVSTAGTEWQRLTASAFISMIVPLGVFFSLQRYATIRGLTAGAKSRG